jgi:hypothetical protein
MVFGRQTKVTEVFHCWYQLQENFHHLNLYTINIYLINIFLNVAI